MIVGKWLKIALINLCIVALLGVTLRYKIIFSLPFIDQRNLHHGHSHFAFSGWITQTIMVLLIYYLQKQKQENSFKKYSWILVTNLIIAYGMLISFSIQGYAFYSILFSTLSVIVSYVFAIIYWRDLRKLNINRSAHSSFKAALVFNIISSMGPLSLAFMKSNHIVNQKAHLIAEFFFLHFQYNGWFFFACIGLLIAKLYEIIGEVKSFKTIFWILALSCIPSYFLSVPWLPLPTIIYILVVISAVMRLVAWVWFLKIIKDHISTIKKVIPKTAKWLLILAAISMSIKVVLQVGSTYYPLSQIVFGFRPIIIGYLHLVLLALISVFILGYIMAEKLIATMRTTTIGLVIFVSGIFINQILLMIQGGAALATKNIPYINGLLFSAALIMFSGLLLITINQIRSHLTSKKTMPVYQVCAEI